jgi:murein DD-endopeptidase MepM/ murein hydrolase activator NlpD
VGAVVRRWALRLAGTMACAVLLPALPALAAAEEQPDEASEAPTDPDDDPAVLALERTIRRAAASLEPARSAVAAAERALHAAEGRRREAEEATVDAVIGLLQAEAQLAEWHRIRMLVAQQRDAATTQLETELAGVRRQAVTAYKLGRPSGTSLATAAIREARNPSELAHNLAVVGAILEHQQRQVDRAEDRLASAERTVALVAANVEAATDAVAAARSAWDAAEAEAAARRVEEDAAEARRLAADDRLLAAEERLAGLTADLADARVAAEQRAAEDAEASAGDLPDSGTDASTDGAASAEAPEEEATEADDEDAPPSLEARRAWLASRQRVHVRDVALDPVHRRLRIGLVCPVAASPRFADDWHFPRSHGRRHEGTDMFAPFGTAIRAPADGTIDKVDRVDAFDGDSDFGGLTVTMTDTAGVRWYLAHLASIPDGLAVGDEVRAGQVLGETGDSGNAAGTPPHLHIGAYVGSAAINPYASLMLACGPWTRSPAFQTPAIVERSVRSETSSSGSTESTSTSAS